jgi:hypothetical protein
MECERVSGLCKFGNFRGLVFGRARAGSRYGILTLPRESL